MGGPGLVHRADHGGTGAIGVMKARGDSRTVETHLVHGSNAIVDWNDLHSSES